MNHTPKDTFRLRMYFSNFLPVEIRIHLVQHEATQHQKRLDFLRSQMAKYPAVPMPDSPDFGDYLVLEGAIMREQTALQWMNKCIEHLMSNGRFISPRS
jgi:hypothetical protein